MKVLLRQNVAGLGSAGQVKEVADGYARNYLFPRGFAIPATPTALRDLEAQKQTQARRAQRMEKETHALAARLQETPIRVLARVGEQHRLYGAVTAADIAGAIHRTVGETVDKRKIELEEPIRRLGSHTVPVKVSRDAIAYVTVLVEPEV